MFGTRAPKRLLEEPVFADASGEAVVVIVVVATVVLAVAVVVVVLATSRSTARWTPTCIHVGIPTWILS